MGKVQKVKFIKAQILPVLKVLEDIDIKHMIHYGPAIPLLNIYPVGMNVYNFNKRFILKCSQQ